MTSVKSAKKNRHHRKALQSGDKKEAEAAGAPPRNDVPTPWYRSTFAVAVAGGLLLWAAFPPLALRTVAWVAPIPWLLLVRMEKLPGRRPYRALYLAGLLHWLILVQWVRLPHWAAYFGWWALALYLAFYIPVFIGLARVAVHQLRMPVVLAAPVVWTGLELVRGHMLTGFSLALLGHSQVDVIPLIQISDLAGAYAVSFVVMFVAACLARMAPLARRRGAFWPVAPALGIVAAALYYGHWRLSQVPVAPADKSAKVALVQGSIDTVFDGKDHSDAIFQEYLDLTHKALERDPEIDLVVWPESMFPFSLISHSYDNVRVRPEHAEEFAKYMERIRRRQAEFAGRAREAVLAPDLKTATPMLVGTEAVRLEPRRVEQYNTALYFDAQGNVVGRYDKVHPVMFGEYVPLGDVLPWLYRLTPMPSGLTAGNRPRVFRVAGMKFSPCICFENTVPHLIRRQVARLKAEGDEPDVLVTITNDGWFWGSSLLDLHLACGRFRAVEIRKPMLIAANTGFSAWIDGNGRVLGKGPRRDRDVVVAEVRADGRDSCYLRYGDLPAGVCGWFCLALAVVGTWTRFGGNNLLGWPRRDRGAGSAAGSSRRDA